MKAKSKTKKNDRKFNRLKYDAKDPPIVETPSCDLAKLRKPIDTSLCNLRQVSKLFETGSEEIKCILAYECEVIYECKICRGLFRSLLNFISHKRVYCTEKFNISCDKSAIDPPSMSVEKENSESKENCKNERLIKSSQENNNNNNNNKKFSKKDLTSVISMLQKKQKDADYDDTKEHKERLHIIADTEQVLLEMMDSNRAAFQTVLEPSLKNVDSEDLMKAQTTEIQTILSRDTAILGPDGQVIELSNEEKCDDPLQFSELQGSVLNDDNMSNNNLVCSLCDVRFSTKKTLTFHMKSLHTPNRLVYPCPSCPTLFPNNWGVYRHLIKVHRKSNAQVRKLRTEIQAKAYRKETTRAQDIEKDCANSKLNDLNESQTVTNETQEWMAHLESDGELQRCGGCGKRFDRKAALLAHSQICQRRLAACSDVAIKSKRKPASEAESSKAESSRAATPASVVCVSNSEVENNSIRIKDNSPPAAEPASTISVSASVPAPAPPPPTQKSNNVVRLPSISPSVTITPVAQDEPAGISIRVEGVSSLSKDAWDKMGTEMPDIVPEVETDPLAITPSDVSINKVVDISDDPEIIFTKIEKSKHPTSSGGSKKRKIPAKRDNATDTNKRANTTTNSFNDQPEKIQPQNNTIITLVSNLQNKIANLPKLECIPCKRKFPHITLFRRHMAEHIDWFRYRCKLCNFRFYDKIDCIAHCNKTHNAKNNRTSIASMIIEITTINDHSSPNAPRSLLKKKNVLKDPIDLEVIDVTKPTTTASDIANANEEMDCIQNGEAETAREKTNNDIEKLTSDSEEETPDKMNEVAKKARLDEDPELRRMVMEVIFGSSEVEMNDKPGSSVDNTRIRANRESTENQSSSSSDSEQATINLNNTSNTTTESLKSDSRLPRAARNRTKLEDKDFIYDLDAVLLKEPVEEELCGGVKITNDNKTNADVNSKLDSDDLSVVLYRDDAVKSKLGKVA